MRDRFQNFMYGRYGTDQLNRFLSLLALILLIVNLFVHVSFLWIAALVLLAWTYFRIFSRNTSKRAVENDRFMDFTSRFRRNGGYGSGYGGYGNGSYGGYDSGSRPRRPTPEERKAQREQRKIYRFYMCPHCGQKVRVPKGKGRIEITCPKCRTAFIKTT